MKTIVSVVLIGGILWAQESTVLQTEGVQVTDGAGKTHTVKRIIPPGCKVPITNSAIWEGEFSEEEVPERCKITLVKTAGTLSPMTIAPGVETYGELEVLQFMQTMQAHKNDYLLVDSRGNDWYGYDTIPGAVNLWFLPLKEPEKFPERFNAILKTLKVVRNKEGAYDFSASPTILLFCNGAWCGQSPAAAKGLLAIGYPPEKMKWYRGGMQSWKSLSMTTTRGEE